MSKSTSNALVIIAPDLSNDVVMGKQLTAQSHKVDAAMVEVLIFGAMVMLLEEKLGEGDAKGGRGKKGGISEWLRQFAPTVSKQKACRYRDVAKSVQDHFKLPAKVSFLALATTPPEALPAKLRTKQRDLFAFVTGTSPNSWLDQFKAIKAPGGAQVSDLPELTPAEKYKAAVAQIREDHKGACDTLIGLAKRKAYQVLPDNELHAVIESTEEFLKHATEWAKTPKAKRTPTFKVS